MKHAKINIILVKRKIQFSKHLFELNNVKGTCYMPGIVLGVLVNVKQF